MSEQKLHLRPRPSADVTIRIPLDVIVSLKKVAERREMSSYEALIKFYVGQGLRDDLAHLFYDHVLTNAAEVLARHNHSPEEIEAILSELRLAAME